MIHSATQAGAIDEVRRNLQKSFTRNPVGSLAAGAQYDDIRKGLEEFAQWVKDQEKRRCTQVVEDEPELTGPMPEGARLLAEEVGLEEALRAAVRSAKCHIIQEIHK